MKKQLIFLALICAFALTACSDGASNQSPDISSGGDSGTVSAAQTDPIAPEEEETENKSEGADTEPSAENTEEETAENTEEGENAPTVAKEDYPDYLYGPGGDKISAEEITGIEYYGYGDKWDYASCEGFTYLAEPTGIAFNSIENADLYNSAEFSFEGAPEASTAVFKRYKIGDTVCGLTLKEAQANFAYEISFGREHPEAYFQWGSAFFDGSVELTGYIVVLVDHEYAVGGPGDVIFIPDNESQVLPIMNYNRFSEERGVYSDMIEMCRSAGGVTYQSEYSFVYCGNVEEYDSTVFAGIEENTPTRVRVTAENVIMSANVDWLANINFSVTDLEIL